MSLTISLQKFRDKIDAIKNQRDSVLLKTAYLIAARNSEVCCNASPYDVLNNASKGYGVFMKCRLQDYTIKAKSEDEIDRIEKVLLIESGVAKRGKKVGKKTDDNETEEALTEVTDHEITDAFTKYGELDLLDRVMSGELQVNPLLVKALLGKVHLKTVALPTSAAYEPWTLDLIRWMHKTKKPRLNFSITRKQFWNILREHLSGIMPKKGNSTPKNILRHFRLSHLTEYYQFEPFDLTLYSGWTARTVFGQIGIPASGNIDSYIHLRWQSYFGKLLVPLKRFY